MVRIRRCNWWFKERGELWQPPLLSRYLSDAVRTENLREEEWFNLNSNLINVNL